MCVCACVYIYIFRLEVMLAFLDPVCVQAIVLRTDVKSVSPVKNRRQRLQETEHMCWSVYDLTFIYVEGVCQIIVFYCAVGASALL